MSRVSVAKHQKIYGREIWVQRPVRRPAVKRTARNKMVQPNYKVDDVEVDAPDFEEFMGKYGKWNEFA